jgi:hypothetical protein
MSWPCPLNRRVLRRALDMGPQANSTNTLAGMRP